jgi:hypothetical protein
MIKNCPVCSPINDFLQNLLLLDFKVIEERIEDHHFHQVYIKVKGNKSQIDYDHTNLKKVDNKYICNCHWSVVEVEG